MPATFPSHAAAVLPLKLWRPRRFDGVALVVGSTAPDLPYALGDLVTWPRLVGGHTVLGLLWFCLPVTVLLSCVVRWAAPVVAAHLPARPGWLALRDYGVLGAVQHSWPVTVTSALIGAASHIVWDGFTHHPDGHGWAVRLIPALGGWFQFAQYASTVLGGLVALGVAVHIGRHRLLRSWHGAAPAIAPVHPVFWPVLGVFCATYPLTWVMLPGRSYPHVQGVRMLWAVGLGVIAGVAAVRVAHRAGWVRDRVSD